MNDCLAATGSDAILPFVAGAILLLGRAVAYVVARRSNRSGRGTTLGLLLVLALGISVAAVGGSAAPARAAGGGCEAAAAAVTTASPVPSVDQVTPPPTTDPTPTPTPTPVTTGSPAVHIVGAAAACGILNDLVVPGERTADRYIAALEAIEPVVPQAVAAAIPVVIAAQAAAGDPGALAAAAPVAAQTVIDDYLSSACRIDGTLQASSDHYYLEFSLSHLDYYERLKLTTTWSSCVDPIIGKWYWPDLDYQLTTVFSGIVTLDTEVPFAQTMSCAFEPTAFNFEYHVWSASGDTQILQGVSGWSSGNIGPGDNSYGVCFDPGRIGTCEWTHFSGEYDHTVRISVAPATAVDVTPTTPEPTVSAPPPARETAA